MCQCFTPQEQVKNAATRSSFHFARLVAWDYPDRHGGRSVNAISQRGSLKQLLFGVTKVFGRASVSGEAHNDVESWMMNREEKTHEKDRPNRGRTPYDF
jgi:hypothetical protein